MRRVLDVATSHYNHISIAMAEGNRIFMWGECLGQSITFPVLTTLGSLHDVFARYASPRVMHQPLVLHDEEPDVNLIDCFREAFNDQVCIYIVKKYHFWHRYFLETVLFVICRLRVISWYKYEKNLFMCTKLF